MGFNVLNYVLAKKNVGGSTVELDSLKQQLAGLQKDLEVIQDADLINRVTSIETLLNQIGAVRLNRTTVINSLNPYIKDGVIIVNFILFCLFFNIFH